MTSAPHGSAPPPLIRLTGALIDYAGLAQSMGVPGSRAGTAEEVASRFRQAISEPGPHLMHPIIVLLPPASHDRDTKRRVLGCAAEARSDGMPAACPPGSLTEAESRILRYLPTHLSAPEIAAELFCSVNTVKTHIRHVYAKLGTNSRSGAVERACALGMIASTRGQTLLPAMTRTARRESPT